MKLKDLQKEHKTFNDQFYDKVSKWGLNELAKELTDKFENIHQDREWDGDFFDEIEEFLEIELQ